MNSKQKGKRGELEAAKAWRELFGGEARRSQQFAGVSGSSDLADTPGLAIEVKRRESLNVHGAVEQAKEAAAANEVPLVLHRKNGKPWLVTLELASLPALAERLSRDYLATPQN